VRQNDERRQNPRLELSYPIELSVKEPGEAGGTRAVTANLCARGAYFKTFSWSPFRAGQNVSVRIQVPHSMMSGNDQIRIDMQATAKVSRMESVGGREALGEDGLDLRGVAVEFEAPLEFHYLCGWGAGR
jgi:hypothetical protein